MVFSSEIPLGVQANLMKCTIWHRLNHAFNILPRAADFNIVKIGHPGSNQLEFTCTSQALAKQSDKLMLKPGHVIMINAIIKSGMPEKRFLGYVTKAHKIDELVHFVVEVSNSHRDDVKISSKVSIIAECNVEGFITAYRLAYEASKSPLFEGIIAPSKLCSSSSNLPMCAKGIKQNSHLDTEQNKVFKSLYNNTIEALMNGKGYVSAVDGFPGSGKSRILTQLIVNLVTSKELTKKKQFKILVTCPSDLKLDALALQLKQFSHRSDAETFQKLDFLVYSVATSESQLKPHIINQRVDNLTKIDPKKYQNRHNTMMELIHKSQIVFTNVNIIYSLKNFCSKFDVILADDASEVDELNSMLSLSMSPSSFILFGDAYKRPINTLELSQKYNNINFNQSLFKRLTRFERCTQKLKFQYRLSSPVAHFLSVCFYGNTLPDCKRKFYDGNQRFELFHRNKDAFVFEFFEKAMQRFPEKATVNIILPPNINGIDLTKKLSAYASRIKISENINLPNKERDIVIICVNESMENLPRYRMSHLHGVFTLAKHAVYIIGTTNKLQHDPNWAHIFSYARKYNFEKNLNVENSNFIKEYFSQ